MRASLARAVPGPTAPLALTIVVLAAMILLAGLWGFMVSWVGAL